MPSTELSNFLRVALDIQATPYPGVHVADGVAAATDGVMLVAKTFSGEFLRGEGAISPKAARVLETLSAETWIGSIEVSGNRVTVTAQTTRYDEKTSGEVAGEYCEVTLPEFYCPRAPVARMFATLTDEGRGWQQIVENPNLKALKEMNARDYVALIDNPRNGGELIRPKADNDTHWYSVAQLRKGLRLFGARARLSVRRNAKGWLAFEDAYGHTFAITPFIKQN